MGGIVQEEEEVKGDKKHHSDVATIVVWSEFVFYCGLMKRMMI